jgi:23S rRNA (cytosine1962-C5)-methyltransferase
MYITPKTNNYELIDSGNSMKLERFGNVTLLRPEPEAIWIPNNPELWDDVDFIFNKNAKGNWQTKRGQKSSWEIEYGGLNFLIKPTAFKHTGLFPEQLSNWEYFEKVSKGKKLKVLNLFGYTGAFSMLALKLGHDVVHVDSSQGVNDWLKENCKLSKLDTQNLKVITDDVVAFVKRLVKRGEKFDFIVLDPPAFGHGTKTSELWKIEEDLPRLIETLGLIMTDKPAGIIISGYAAGYSPETYKNLLLPFKKIFGGEIEADVMTIEESKTKRQLTVGIAARWHVK